MTRKIIQIATTYDPDVQEYQLFALTNDGLVWHITEQTEIWARLPDVPQADEP